MSDEFASLLGKNGVGSEEIVIKAFLNTDLGTNGVLEGTDGEWQGWEALVDLSEESAGLLELQVVLGIELTLVDGSTELALLGLTFTGRHIDVEADDIAGGELELLNALLRGLLVDDDIVAVNEVLLELVRKDTFDGVNAELLADLGNSLGHLGVSGLLADDSLSGKCCVVGGKDNVGLLAGDLGGGIG